MFFTCSPACTDPTHQHGPRHAAATKTASKRSAKVSPNRAAQKTVRNAKGQSKVVDIHCHYLNPVVAQKTAHLNAAAHDYSIIYAIAYQRTKNCDQGSKSFTPSND